MPKGGVAWSLWGCLKEVSPGAVGGAYGRCRPELLGGVVWSLWGAYGRCRLEPLEGPKERSPGAFGGQASPPGAFVWGGGLKQVSPGAFEEA